MKGSASVVTDANGNKLDDCDFLPFGQTLCQTSSSGNHYLYTGLERDADQLDHTLHRQYSSSLGRWMSPDPGGVKVVHLNNPQTWNLYAYVSDNPTTFVDPTGLQQGVPNSAPADADSDGCSSAVQTNTTQTCGTVQEQYKSEIEAEIYGEKTKGTVSEYEAMASVIVNRAKSGDKQFVDKGKSLNIHNVLSHTYRGGAKAFGAYKGTNYNKFYSGSKMVSQTTRTKVETAVAEVFSHGTTTKAISFIAPPKGTPTSAEVRALGNVVPANPASVGGVYLYVLKPPDP